MTTTHTPLSFGALHRASYKKDPLTGNWVKGVQPELHEVDDEEVGGGEQNDVPPPELASTPTSSSAPL